MPGWHNLDVILCEPRPGGIKIPDTTAKTRLRV